MRLFTDEDLFRANFLFSRLAIPYATLCLSSCGLNTVEVPKLKTAKKNTHTNLHTHTNRLL